MKSLNNEFQSCNNIEKNQRGDSALAAKAGFWYVCGNFVGKAVTFITTPIFARLMSASDFGEFSNFANWAVMLTILVGVELYNTVSRAYYDFKENYDEYISSVTVLGGLLTIVTYVVFLISSSYIFKVVAIPEQYVHLLFVFLFFSFCRSVFYARERTLYRYKTVAVITFLSLLVPTIISVFLVYLLPETNRLSARLYGYYVPSAVIGLFCAGTLFSKGITFKWSYCRYALVLSIPLLVHYLTAYLLTSTNVIIAKNMAGAAEAAIVSIAISTTHILTVFFQATSGALTTWVMDNLELGKEDKVRKGTFFYVILLAVIIMLTILLTPEIIYILGGKKYAASVSLLPGLAFASFIQSITTVFTIILTYDKNLVKTAVCSGIFALVSIIVKVLLLPDYGLMALVYVNIAVFIALFFINYFLIKNAGYANTVFLRGMFAVMALTGLIVVLSPVLYKCQDIRYALTGVFLVVCTIAACMQKNSISAVVEKLKKKKPERTGKKP